MQNSWILPAIRRKSARGLTAPDCRRGGHACRNGPGPGDAGQRELQRLLGWLDSRTYALAHSEITLACGHTARLLGAIARVQAAQATSALALARLDGKGVVQRIIVERAGE
jgi:hypothetical protein